ncbi:MAG TPA: chloride channel protein, partial [Candidatus Dormibacteraeota bacterium]|nr:chloride channel protein [Candidatus Dormibacteraeota bacterium]
LEDRFEDWSLNPILKTTLGFGLVGVIGIFYPQVFGVGYDHIQQVLYEHVPWPHALMLGILKPLATALTLGSGGSGGIFSPSLYTGAMIGNVFGHFAHQLFPTWTGPAAAYGLVAMAGVFAGAAEAPITAMTIVFEMSNDYTIVLPLMITSVIATVMGRYLIGSTVYALKLERRGIDWEQVKHPSPFALMRISSIERKPTMVARAEESIHGVLARTGTSAELVIPVIHGDRFLGTVTTLELAGYLARGEEATMGSLARPAAETLDHADTLEKAIALMSDPSVSLLPVVDSESGAFVGVVTRRDVIAAYQTGGTRHAVAAVGIP